MPVEEEENIIIKDAVAQVLQDRGLEVQAPVEVESGARRLPRRQTKAKK